MRDKGKPAKALAQAGMNIPSINLPALLKSLLSKSLVNGDLKKM